MIERPPPLYILRLKDRGQLKIVLATLKWLKREPVASLGWVSPNNNFEAQLRAGDWPPLTYGEAPVKSFLLFLRFHPLNAQVEVGWMQDTVAGEQYALNQKPANGDETSWNLFRNLELLPNAFSYDGLPKLPSQLAGYAMTVSPDGFTLKVGCEHIQFGMIQRIMQHMALKQELFKEATRQGYQPEKYDG